MAVAHREHPSLFLLRPLVEQRIWLLLHPPDDDPGRDQHHELLVLRLIFGRSWDRQHRRPRSALRHGHVECRFPLSHPRHLDLQVIPAWGRLCPRDFRELDELLHLRVRVERDVLAIRADGCGDVERYARRMRCDLRLEFAIELHKVGDVRLLLEDFDTPLLPVHQRHPRRREDGSALLVATGCFNERLPLLVVEEDDRLLFAEFQLVLPRSLRGENAPTGRA